jgi:hypothetical protein
MSLIPFWYIIIAILWTGFFILEGFDFGVGMLHSLVGGDEAGHRAAINTIGPLWDGNEVWLIVAGAGMFAAFPGWYATMFSAYNLALVLLLAALIVRGWRSSTGASAHWAVASRRFCRSRIDANEKPAVESKSESARAPWVAAQGAIVSGCVHG